MAYPIRFKLVPKSTEVKPLACPILYPDGTPASYTSDTFYDYVNKVSCAEYELWVALDKNADGTWNYRKVGY